MAIGLSTETYREIKVYAALKTDKEPGVLVAEAVEEWWKNHPGREIAKESIAKAEKETEEPKPKKTSKTKAA